jgi:sirohydrochlorin ferrochelatase
MKALLIISHGSRRRASNQEVFALTDTLRQQTSGTRVACAFLEIAPPKIQDAMDELIENGATDILVFPHFLAAGTHVAHDIPRALDAARTRHPGITITLLPHLGALPGIPDLILNQLNHA